MKKKRPIAFIVITIIWFLSIVYAIPFLVADTLLELSNPFADKLFVMLPVLLVIIQLICVYGLWNVSKWGVVGLVLVFLVRLILNYGKMEPSMMFSSLLLNLGLLILVIAFWPKKIGVSSKKNSVEKTAAKVEKSGGYIRIVPREEEDNRNKVDEIIKESSKYLTEDPQKAIYMLDQILGKFPNHYGAYINRGIAFNSLGDHEKAIQDFKHSIRIYPNCYVAHVNLASVYEKHGEKMEAVKIYNQALSVIPPANKSDIEKVKAMINKLNQAG